MRITGNIIPQTLTIEPYPSKGGYVEIRLRENIKETTIYNGQADKPIYEYDEYVFVLPARDGLCVEIEANLADWLATGRTLEQNTQASAYVDLRTALAILGVNE